uniref:Formamidopyrimidine-DNA glycosylase n=1 Tax=Geobacillus sp. (strain WCH70) TaxID=471223 RepID=C5D649_GEOSW
MPELPEVEIIRRTLIPLTAGKTIADIQVFWPKIIKYPADVTEFIETMKGQTIRDIHRRGKFLKFTLDEHVLISHLRMEGRYAVCKKEDPIEPHTHIIFRFIDGTELRYRDVRKFGTMHLYRKGEEEARLPLSQLGPEPFSETFTANFLAQRLRKTNRTIKTALLDQTVVVGLGNIYVDESLFRAGIHPERISSSLTDEEVARLHREMVTILQEAIEKGGSTVRSYVNTNGEAGTFQLQLFVYGRKGEPCQRCGQPIQKTVVAGRGTHYCAFCQH